MNNVMIVLTLVVGIGVLYSRTFAQSVGSAVAAGKEYVHALERSAFDVGTSQQPFASASFMTLAGSKGAFYTNSNTHATLAVLNASDEVFVPLSTDPEVHSRAAREYFLSAGIPENEVSGTHVTTTIMSVSTINQPIDSKNMQLLYYTSHLERSLGGVRVADSYAYVAFDSSKRVITEGVYWPAISTDVVARGQALAKMLADSAGRASFVNVLRRSRPDIADLPGEVQIVHTAPGHVGAFEAHAVFVIASKSGPNAGKATAT